MDQAHRISLEKLFLVEFGKKIRGKTSAFEATTEWLISGCVELMMRNDHSQIWVTDVAQAFNDYIGSGKSMLIKFTWAVESQLA